MDLKEKITKDKNGENIPYLEITEEIILVRCNIVKNDYQEDPEFCIDLL